MKRVMGVVGSILYFAVASNAAYPPPVPPNYPTNNTQQIIGNGDTTGQMHNVLMGGSSVGRINNNGNANIDIGVANGSPINQTTNYVDGSRANSNSSSRSNSNSTAYGGAGGDATAYGGSGGSGGTGVGFGGESDASSSASINVNYKDRTGVVSPMSPYLPYWNHEGWGRSDAYYANGPTEDKSVYERSFNPRDPEDMDQLRHTLQAVPYHGLMSIIPGIFNQIGLVFGCADNYHHGRGFQIANSLVRERRPIGKPLMVLYTDDIDRRVFKKANYAYVGKISIEGHQNRNWDQVYCAAIAEVLPWDVDVVIIDGGMKGVSVGSNSSFPNGGAGFSQANYSLSLLGGLSSGITEAKGKPIISAEAFRYSPRLRFKRSISRQFYTTLRSRFPELQEERAVTYGNPTGGSQGIRVRPEMYQMAGFAPNQRVDCMSVPEVQN